VIGLPALSPSVEESKIVQWKKKEGDLVEADDAIASVQTDKAELDWQVTDDVYLAKILLEAGKQVPVGTPACIFVEDAKDVAAFKDYKPGDASSSSAEAPSSAPTSTPKAEPAKPAPAASSAAPAGNYPEHNVEGMPSLSPTATDGAVVEWLVKEGDAVEEGSGIAEIQTDKSVVTWTSTDDAFVAKLLVAADGNNKLPIGTPLAVFVDEKKDIGAFKDYVPGAPAAAPASSGAAASPPSAAAAQAPSGRQPSIQFRYGVRDTPKAAAAKTAPAGGRVTASPYARKKAAELGVDLSAVASASGYKGRITAADVEAASKQKPAAAKAEEKKGAALKTMPARTIVSDRSYEDIPVSVMREIIGKRLSESKFTSPHFYVTMECEMDSLMRMRTEMNDGEDLKISVNDFVLKACGAALRDVPDCNVGWIVEGNNKPVLRKYNYVDISVAVATPAGLITPIIKDVDRKTLSEISFEMKELAKKAKANKLLPEEFQGGTFTISNMGMYGVSNFTAIINPPQACILAVGGAKRKLVPADNEKGFKAVTTMEVTLSSDHRSVDGALAAVWVNAFQKYVQNPAKLML